MFYIIIKLESVLNAFFVLVDANFIFNFDWGVKDKDGVAYGVILNETLTYTTKRSYYKLDNLFNGDKVLGELFYIQLRCKLNQCVCR